MVQLTENDRSETQFVWLRRPESDEPVRFIAIEGVIGAGKTTLATELAKRTGSQLLLEEFEENPFLRDFYTNREDHAFETQMFFLLSRYRQLLENQQPDLFHELIISDYTFAKDRLFGSLTLDDHDFQLYDAIYRRLAEKLTQPDILLYLDLPVESLHRNIRRRGREYEQSIEEQYLLELDQTYRTFLAKESSVPTLVVRTEHLNVRDNSEVVEKIIRELGLLQQV